MWTYTNPVKIRFGAGSFQALASAIEGRRYAIVTYPDEGFRRLVAGLAENAGDPALVIDDVAPNPDLELLGSQCGRFAELDRPVELIVAVGGGSVLDSAKVFALAAGDFDRVRTCLEAGQPCTSEVIAMIAVPTTAGTGSEVTCWATVWDNAAGKKYSLSRPALYAETAIVDPELMIGKPRALTVSTGLDALSHALESIWNVNANPVSARFAVAAAREILDCLPRLIEDLANLDLRTRMAEAALFAGLAFSNTKTAIAHNLSYPITLDYDVPHGIACSFTLPVVLESVADLTGFRGSALRAIHGEDLSAGARSLKSWMVSLGVATGVEEIGIAIERWDDIVTAAFAGERGRNFVGDKTSFGAAAKSLELV